MIVFYENSEIKIIQIVVNYTYRKLNNAYGL